MLAVCAFSAAACGPKVHKFIKLDHPKAGDHLLYEVELYYEGEPLPKGTTTLGHIILTDRNTDCETAAMIAIVKMQKQAKFKGGDALINLRTKATKPEGEEDDEIEEDDEGEDEGGDEDEDGEGGVTHNDKGYWCTRMKGLEGGADFTSRIWEITWEAPPPARMRPSSCGMAGRSSAASGSTVQSRM